MFINEVCNCLTKAKIPYAVVGGYAVALHGAVRGTVDVDIVIHWTLENLKKIESAFKEIGLISLLPINASDLFNFKKEYISQRNLVAWNFYDPKKPVNQVDLVITYDLKNAGTKLITTNAGKIKILSKKDLIEMKKASGRQQDLEDVKALESL